MQQTYFLVVVLFSIVSLSQTPIPNTSKSQLPQAYGSLAAPSYEGDFGPVVQNGLATVTWDKQHLVSFDLSNRGPVSLYGKDGTLLFSVPLMFEKATKTYLRDAAVTSSGTVVVAASALTNDGVLADLIAELGNDGIRRVIRTSPFYPLKVCSAQDGTVWAYGWERNANGSDRRGHHPMLREFSFEKGQLRTEVDRATVQPPARVPVAGSRRELQMRCGSSKVVVFNGPNSELVEYDLATSRVDRWSTSPLPDGIAMTDINGAALTDSGQVYVSFLRGGYNASTGVFGLQVNASGLADWRPVIVGSVAGGQFRVVGSDGEDLVYSRDPHSPRLFWSKVLPAEVTK